MESQSLYQELPPSAPVEKATVVEDFVDVFYAPSQVFERRRDGQFGLALLLLFVLAATIFFATRSVMQPVFDIMVDQQVAALRQQQPGMSEADVAKARPMFEMTMMVLPLVSIPIIALVVGTVLWFVGKLFDSQQTFGQALAVSTYAQVPRFVLGGLVSAGMALLAGDAEVTSPYAYTLSLARFAPDASFAVQSLLVRFELFTLWTTFLLGLGLAITGRIPKRQAFVAAAIVWGLGTLIAGLQTLGAG